MIIKVCGMRDAANISAVEALGPDLMGLIFAPKSPRYVGSCPKALPRICRRVGVFVDAPADEVRRAAAAFSLSLVQLHGQESPDYCRRLGVPVVKAFAVDAGGPFPDTAPYEGLCRYFLFDTRCPTAGGSGRQFPWSRLDEYRGGTPFLLSGGIGPADADAVKAIPHPMMAGADLNSRFETAPAIKDTAALAAFIARLRQ